MPRRKPKPEKQIQEKIKETLDSIVSEEGLDIQPLNSGDLPRLKNSVMMDFELEKINAGTTAKNLLDKMVDFYLDVNLIGEEEHIESKKKFDTMNLSSMLLQIKTSQHTIIKIMEEIDLGNMNPRLIDGLVSLQNQIMKMPKDYQDYMEKMEDSYKRMKTDHEHKKLRGGVNMDDSGNLLPSGKQDEGIKVRGNRGLMENLRDILGSEIEDVTLEEIEDKAVVNAKKKLTIDKDRNSKDTDHTDSDKYDVDDDLFNT